jgi:hypothetical protein
VIQGVLRALVEVHWARSVKAPTPHISGLNLQLNNIIDTRNEESNVDSKQETAAEKEWEIDHLKRVPAPWTDSCPHQQIANQLAGGGRQ